VHNGCTGKNWGPYQPESEVTFDGFRIWTKFCFRRNPLQILRNLVYLHAPFDLVSRIPGPFEVWVINLGWRKRPNFHTGTRATPNFCGIVGVEVPRARVPFNTVRFLQKTKRVITPLKNANFLTKMHHNSLKIKNLDAVFFSPLFLRQMKRLCTFRGFRHFFENIGAYSTLGFKLVSETVRKLADRNRDRPGQCAHLFSYLWVSTAKFREVPCTTGAREKIGGPTNLSQR
jgi:hypothetical protein